MSTPAFTQVDSGQWPAGPAAKIAVTRVNSELLARAFDLEFQEGTDRRVAAVIRTRSGRLLRLVRRTGESRPGTEVHAAANDEFVPALREFLDAFDLSAQDLSWMRDDIRAEKHRLAEQRVDA